MRHFVLLFLACSISKGVSESCNTRREDRGIDQIYLAEQGKGVLKKAACLLRQPWSAFRVRRAKFPPMSIIDLIPPPEGAYFNPREGSRLASQLFSSFYQWMPWSIGDFEQRLAAFVTRVGPLPCIRAKSSTSEDHGATMMDSMKNNVERIVIERRPTRSYILGSLFLDLVIVRMITCSTHACFRAGVWRDAIKGANHRRSKYLLKEDVSSIR